ncbi:hypothetical protein [Ruegeria sp. Ofav3-42]|uniref:hypothetical protein n=1 Tax=Ruegeria sp. Ofav3-42 TaxID=2917759 RepID=UPI001EF57AB6|nr:hypothetical protein [Ruegeria sp. Ofav3-42]MCG7522278.1 hypothetical protein [Ruegeria sp. Ofav3-42]
MPPELEPKIKLYEDLLEQGRGLFSQATKRWMLVGLPVFACWVFFAGQILQFISVTFYSVATVFVLPAIITWDIKRKREALKVQMLEIESDFHRKGLNIACDPGLNISVDKRPK